MCERPGSAQASQGPIWIVFIQQTLLYLTHTHTHSHTFEHAVHTQAEFTPLLPVIQCSSSTLFRNTVTQSYQLFIKDFYCWSAIDREIEFKGEEVKNV